MSWRRCTLGDVITLKRGHDLPEKKRVEGPVPIVSSSGITGHHNQAKAEPPGVVTGRYGTIGEVFYVQEPYWPLNTALYVIDFKGNEPRFVSYLLRNTLRNYRTEKAAVPGVDRNVLHKLTVRTPDRATQESIAWTLSAYDELIENNRRRIALLEEAAQMLYREWFLHFRFPGHEHVKIIEGIPESWERRRIADMCSFLGRGILPIYDDEGAYAVVNQKCIRDRLLSMGPARRQAKEYVDDKGLQYLDVLINSTGTGTLGRVAQCWFEPEATTFDSHVTVARPGAGVDPFWFGYALLELQKLFEGMGAGATNQKELSRGRIADTRILIPPHPLQMLFGEFAGGTTAQIQTLTTQSERLAQARDLLLPHLMNGEIAV